MNYFSTGVINIQRHNLLSNVDHNTTGLKVHIGSDHRSIKYVAYSNEAERAN